MGSEEPRLFARAPNRANTIPIVPDALKTIASRENAVRLIHSPNRHVAERTNVFVPSPSYGDYAGANADARRETGDLVVQKSDAALNPVVTLDSSAALEERA